LTVKEYHWERTTKTDIVVPIRGRVVVTVGRPRIVRIVVPTAPAQRFVSLSPLPHQQLSIYALPP